MLYLLFFLCFILRLHLFSFFISVVLKFWLLPILLIPVIPDAFLRRCSHFSGFRIITPIVLSLFLLFLFRLRLLLFVILLAILLFLRLIPLSLFLLLSRYMRFVSVSSAMFINTIITVVVVSTAMANVCVAVLLHLTITMTLEIILMGCLAF